MRDKVEGTVFLYAVIRADGTVDRVRVLQSLDARLDQSAMRALQKWHFRPGTKLGAAVDVEAVVQIPFRVTKLKW
jgi:TonB family protein